MADDDIDGDGTGNGAKHEPDRQREHVEDHEVLQGARVQRLQSQVREGDQPKPPAEDECRGKGGGGEQRGRYDRRGHRQRARCNRSAALDRMAPIALAVHDVVDQIDDARERTEDDECGA